MDLSNKKPFKNNLTKLSHQGIAALSRITFKVREELGVFKVSDLINNRRDAFDFFVQSVLLEKKDELASLIRLVNDEMNIEKHVVNALDAYFTQIKLQVKNKEIIQRNQLFLTKLATQLYGVKVDGSSYRQAVNQLLCNVENHEKKYGVDLARNFYPYWMNANKLFMEATDKQGSEDIAQKESFIEMWNGLDKNSLSPIADEKLTRYTDAMKRIGLRAKEVDVRKKIAKVILLESLKYSQSAEGYRTNIDFIQTRFTSVRLKDYVLAVSREFYRFWSDTQASS